VIEVLINQNTNKNFADYTVQNKRQLLD